MQSSALFADESVLFAIHQLPLLNTEQFSLKTHSPQGDKNPPVRHNTSKLSLGLTSADTGRPKCRGVGWDEGERVLGREALEIP